MKVKKLVRGGIHKVYKAHDGKCAEVAHTMYYKVEPVRNESKKVGRNEPCPCDSGKKFKKCCGAR